MKYLLLISLVMSSIICFGQQLTDVTSVQYCTIIGKQGALKNTVSIDIDFGNELSKGKIPTSYKEHDVTETKEFKSMTTALNYMSNKGWSLDNTYAVRKSNNKIFHYWILKRNDLAKMNKSSYHFKK